MTYPGATQPCVLKQASALQILGASAVAAGVALAAFPASDGASVFTEVGMCSALPTISRACNLSSDAPVGYVTYSGSETFCLATCMSRRDTVSHTAHTGSMYGCCHNHNQTHISNA